MPTYEYACKSCEEHIEVVQSFSDAPLTECRSCGGTLRKVFSPIGITFKGSGFYKTDSRSGSTSPAGSKDGSTGKESAAKESGKDSGSKETAAAGKSGDSGSGKSASSGTATTSSASPKAS